MSDWQARASQLINVIDPQRGFAAGEFENLTDEQWADLLVELRTLAGTDHAREAATLRAQLAAVSKREGARQKALAAGLTEQDLEDYANGR